MQAGEGLQEAAQGQHGLGYFRQALGSGGHFQVIARFGVVAFRHLPQIQGRQGFLDIIP
jgi:hypothetical protein